MMRSTTPWLFLAVFSSIFLAGCSGETARKGSEPLTRSYDIKGKVAGETATSNWAQVARDHGARVESVEGFTQAIKLLNQGRVDLVINDSIAVYAYLAETGDKSVKIAGNTGEKSEQGRPAPNLPQRMSSRCGVHSAALRDGKNVDPCSPAAILRSAASERRRVSQR